MKNINPLSMFDEHFLLERITKLKDTLVKVDAHIEWKIFAPILDVVFNKPENRRNAGRPPLDRVMMFKILILQSLFNVSDEKMEFQINDRLSFKRFLGLKSSDRVPDSKTLWQFRETLIQEEIVEALFYRFNQAFDDQGIFANTGQIVDASLVEVPRQRNTREENKEIKAGKTPEAWKEKPNKLRQKDVDARWVKKNKLLFNGYKNHIKADKDAKLISTYAVSSAYVHDSQELEALIDRQDASQKLYADLAYTGQNDGIDWYVLTQRSAGKRRQKPTIDQCTENFQSLEIKFKGKGGTYLRVYDQQHGLHEYLYDRDPQSCSKNWADEFDLQYDALRKAQENNLYLHGINASSCKQNGVFHVQILTKNTFYQHIKIEILIFAIQYDIRDEYKINL